MRKKSNKYTGCIELPNNTVRNQRQRGWGFNVPLGHAENDHKVSWLARLISGCFCSNDLVKFWSDSACAGLL